ncbi:hypothetical protein IW23_01790, partial [Campylobacter fetus subsp. venerealis]
MLLMDKDAKIIMHPTIDYIGKTLSATKEILKNYQNKNFDKYGRLTYTHEDGSLKIGQCATTKFDGWIICSNVDAKYFQSKVDAILYKQLLISFIFIIIAAFAVWILAKRLLQPTQSI